MSTVSISPPFPIFTDSDGTALENGYIFIGIANLGPIGNPISIYWDAALTIPAAQPIRTLAGYPINNGTPARLYVSSQYSIQVQNRNGSVVYSAPVDTEFMSSANISYLPAGTGAVATTVQSKLRESVSVKDFGAVGDGVTDDTAAVQAWLTYCGTNNFLARGYGLCKITSALTYSGDAGIDWDFNGYDDTTANGGFLVSGTGYTAITISGKPSKLNFSLFGTGNTANGALLQNVVLVKESNIRVDNLNGFGVKINKCWDCTFNHISVESCGNTSQYAFSMNDDGETCNMTHIGHLQVELSNTQAIYISPNSISLVIDSIHSERVTPNASYNAWVLGGGSSQYNSVRLNSSGTSANAKALLNGIDATYIALRAEGNIPVTVDCSAGASTIVGPKIFGTYAEVTSQTGQVNIHGGVIAAIAGGGQVSNTHYYGTLLAGVYQGIYDGVPYAPVFTSSGTAFAIGNGTITGKYWLVGNRVRVQGAITMGSTTTFGTGSYNFSLPFVSANDGFTALGVAFINDSGTAINIGTTRITPAVSTADFWTGSVPASQLGATSPQTFAVNDSIAFDIEYTRT